MKLVLDSSVVIDFLRRKDKLNSWYWKGLNKSGEFVMSVVSVAEVFAGKSVQVGGKQEDEWRKMLDGMQMVGVDVLAAERAGKIRSESGVSLGDAFVAALALEQKLPVLTLDKNDFKRVKGLKFYSVEGKRKGN